MHISFKIFLAGLIISLGTFEVYAAKKEIKKDFKQIIFDELHQKYTNGHKVNLILKINKPLYDHKKIDKEGVKIFVSALLRREERLFADGCLSMESNVKGIPVSSICNLTCEVGLNPDQIYFSYYKKINNLPKRLYIRYDFETDTETIQRKPPKLMQISPCGKFEFQKAISHNESELIKKAQELCRKK